MKKQILLLSLIFMTAAGCNVLGGTTLGVLKTVDGGGTWAASNKVENVKDASIAGLTVTDMVFDPGNHERIYLSSANGGLWLSNDSGQNWKALLSKFGAFDFVLNPFDTNNILVAGIFGDHGRIVRTKDGGATWEEVYTEASTGNAVNTITANPKNPGEIYAALDSGVIIKSIDGGTNWFVLQETKDRILRIRYNSINNSLYSISNTRGLWKSTDGGLNWTQITNSLTGAIGIQSFVGDYVGRFYKMSMDDQTAGVLYVSTDKGLYKSTNDGRNWTYLNLPIRSSEELPRAVASTHGGVLAYTSIGSTIFKTLDGGKSWQTQNLPTENIVNKIIIDPVFPQITYAGLTER